MECRLLSSQSPKPIPKPHKKKALVLPSVNSYSRKAITAVQDEPSSKPYDLREVLNALKASKKSFVHTKTLEDFEPKENEVCDLKFIGDIGHLDIQDTYCTFSSPPPTPQKEEEPVTANKSKDEEFVPKYDVIVESFRNELILSNMLVEQDRKNKTLLANSVMRKNYINAIQKIRDEAREREVAMEEKLKKEYDKKKQEIEEAKEQIIRDAEKNMEEMRLRDEAYRRERNAEFEKIMQQMELLKLQKVIEDEKPIEVTETQSPATSNPSVEEATVPNTALSISIETNQPALPVASPQPVIAATLPQPVLPVAPPQPAQPATVPQPVLPSTLPQSDMSVSQNVEPVTPKILETGQSAENEFLELSKSLSQLRHQSNDIENNPDLMMKLCRALSIVNQFSSLADDEDNHIKFHQLLALLDGKPIKLARDMVSTNGNIAAIAFVKLQLPKRIVDVGHDLQVVSLAVYASALVKLWIRSPELGKIIYLNLGTMCPYLVPRMKNSLTGIEYQQFIGYKIQNGKLTESSASYCARMKALGELYGRIVSMDISDHPHGLLHGWMWLSRALNQPPLTSVMACVLHGFLSVSADVYLKVYKSQFKKLMLFLSNQYVKELKSDVVPASNCDICALEDLSKLIMTSQQLPLPAHGHSMVL